MSSLTQPLSPERAGLDADIAEDGHRTSVANATNASAVAAGGAFPRLRPATTPGPVTDEPGRTPNAYVIRKSHADRRD
jgi:hypothetical protein